MNRVMSATPALGGWWVQVLLADGTLRWIPCVGSFRACVAQAVQWEPEEGEDQ